MDADAGPDVGHQGGARGLALTLAAISSRLPNWQRPGYLCHKSLDPFPTSLAHRAISRAVRGRVRSGSQHFAAVCESTHSALHLCWRMPFNLLPENTHAALTALAAAVSTVRPSSTQTFAFKTGALVSGQEPVALVKEVADWAAGDGRFVYYFEADADESSLAELHRAITAARDAKHEARKYARLFEPNRVWYVGGSASLGTRFRQHLGYGNKAVYAMQLAYWANVRDVPVRFTAARYAPTVSNEALGALEDQLWSQLKPMMGRQGRK